jgi:hypothetical protein
MNRIVQSAGVAVEIGGLPILLRSADDSFLQMLQDRYAGFVSPSQTPQLEFDINLQESPSHLGPDDDVSVQRSSGCWLLERGDFRAEWDPEAGRGSIIQPPNPYAVDSVLRIVHTLLLARQGGFLVHAASAIRNGNAFLFAGISGAGKTTISRLAPEDTILLTDEISYVRRQNGAYYACGTPFAGELAKLGENASAPLRTLFLLAKGPENRIQDVPAGEAVRQLLRNVLFFTADRELVDRVFQSAFDFVQQIPVRWLTFVPDERVWEMIGTFA